MWIIFNTTREEAMMSPLTSTKKQHARKTIPTRLLVAQADGGSAEGRAKDLTCNEAEVDALLSSGEST
jgi:hypothetical protein